MYVLVIFDTLYSINHYHRKDSECIHRHQKFSLAPMHSFLSTPPHLLLPGMPYLLSLNICVHFIYFIQLVSYNMCFKIHYSLFIHLLMDFWFVSSFRQLQLKPLKKLPMFSTLPSHQQYLKVPFPQYPNQYSMVSLLHFSHSDRCVVVPHWF